MLIDYLIYFINSQVATVAYLGGGYATAPFGLTMIFLAN
jgi:hypothetical protein